MFKKIFFSFLFLFIISPSIVRAQEAKELIFFGTPTCPHCQKEREWLKDVKQNYPEIKVKEYDLGKNLELLESFYEQYKVPKNQRGLIPITFQGDNFWVGFNESTPQEIIGNIKGEEKKDSFLLEKIDIHKYSLPVLAITLGAIDGFNVCSLGALVIILSLVMILKSRKRILILGGVFLLVTGITYALLILMWNRLFHVLSSYLQSLEIIIAIISFLGAFYLIKEFIKSRKQGATCESNGIISKLSPKVEKAFLEKKNLFLLLGVIVLFALAVTIVEFPCSAVLPVLFAGALAEANLSLFSTFSYLALFIFFYLLDELIIFVIAILTLKIKIFSPKFINFFNLIAALIFIFMAVYYLGRWWF